MDSQNPSSFEKEFNRLSFLASIATSDSSTTTVSSAQKAQITPIKPSVKPSSSVSQHKTVVVNGGLGSGKLDIEKINKILNSNAQITNQSQTIYLNASKQGTTLLCTNKSIASANVISSNVTTATLITTPATKSSVSSTSYIQPLPGPDKKLSSVTVRPPIKLPKQVIATPAASSLPNLNQPLIISSSPQKIQEHTSGSQTILLPANFAGELKLF